MNFVIFDLESTCGWKNQHRQSEIIEIGAVKLDDNLNIVDEFQSFVRPVVNPELTPFCTELTSIAQADVDNAPLFNEVAMSFYKWCCDYESRGNTTFAYPYWLCSWGHYDKKQLRADSLFNNFVLGEDWLENHISVKHQHGTLIGVKNGIGLQKALDMYGLKFDGTAHRAISDARNTVKIFREIFPHLKFERR